METKKPEKGQLFVKRDSILVENMPTYHERRIMAHGDEMMCVEAGALLDFFTPMREEFVK